MPNESGNKTFVDSNIWLYAFLDDGKTDKSLLADRLIRHNHFVISTQVINEVCSNLLRKSDYSNLQIEQLVAAFYGQHQVIPFNQQLFMDASRLRSRYSLSYWDSLVVAAALAAGATQLLTEDMQDGLLVDERLRIVNPFNTEK